MSLATKLRRAPLRISTGAFILNTGIDKINGDDDAAKGVHGMASGAYPFLEKVPPKVFLKSLAVGEITLGSALLLPIVPAGLAGLGLIGFSSGLLTTWWRTPGMHGEGHPRPTQRGVPIAKDVWMLGSGVSLLIDAALSESPVTNEQSRAETKAAIRAEAKAARKAAHRTARRAQRTARKQAAHLIPG